MIYIDTSVALATLFSEPRKPPEAFWAEPLVSSRLLEYENIVRLNAKRTNPKGQLAAHKLLGEVELLDLSSNILTRALQPFPVSVRTLDALHLASMDYLRAHGQTVELASYDTRLASAAAALGFAVTKI